MKDTNEDYQVQAKLFELFGDLLLVPRGLFCSLSLLQCQLFVSDILLSLHVPSNKIKNKVLIRQFLYVCFGQECSAKGNPETILSEEQNTIRESVEYPQRDLTTEQLNSMYAAVLEKIKVSVYFLNTLTNDQLQDFAVFCHNIEESENKSKIEISDTKKTVGSVDIATKDSLVLSVGCDKTTDLFAEFGDVKELRPFLDLQQNLTFTQSKCLVLHTFLCKTKGSIKRNLVNRFLDFLEDYSNDDIRDIDTDESFSQSDLLLVRLINRSKRETAPFRMKKLSSNNRNSFYSKIKAGFDLEPWFQNLLSDEQLKTLVTIASINQKVKSITKINSSADTVDVTEVKPKATIKVNSNITADLSYDETAAMRVMFKEMRTQLFDACICGQDELRCMSDKEVVSTYMRSASFQNF